MPKFTVKCNTCGCTLDVKEEYCDGARIDNGNISIHADVQIEKGVTLGFWCVNCDDDFETFDGLDEGEAWVHIDGKK